MKCVCVKKPEVEADQQDSLIEAGTNQQKGEKVQRTILRWNFPTLGTVYLDVHAKYNL